MAGPLLRRSAYRSSPALRNGVLVCVAVFCCTQVLRLWGPGVAPTAAVITGKVDEETGDVPWTGVRSTVQHVSRWPGRMTERFLGPVNFDRATLRIDSMDTYALCSAVMLQVLVGLYGATTDAEDDADKVQRASFEAQMAFLMVASLCACFTMVLFLLNKVYSSTAIGMWKDVAYFNFQYHTAQQRKYAFWSLITAVVCFMCSFSISLFDRYGGVKGTALVVASMIIGIIMCQSVADLMNIANDTVFESYPY